MKKKYLFPLLIFPLLMSCSKSFVLQYIPFTNYLPSMDVNIDFDNDIYYQKKDFKPIDTALGQYDNIRDILLNYKDNKQHHLLPNKGDINLLIIPVRFIDSPKDISYQDKEIILKNAFFADPSMTIKESVSSFYHKSSYGQIKINGEVAPWYDINLSSDACLKLGSNQTESARKITLMALKHLKKINYDLDKFDSDNDGIIDAIQVIYDYPYNGSGKNDHQDLFWAFTDFISPNENNALEGELLANAYSWESLYFAVNESYQADASIYIHELGHLFGLSDYYNTNEKELGYYYQPTGFLDVMDSNQGDHTALSKYLLNWSSPKILKKGFNGTIKLQDFSKTGDYLLLPLDDHYDDNPFGEYLFLEYFIPQGLNKGDGLIYQDNDINGENIYFSFPNVRGLKVYHVDARLAYFSKKIVGPNRNYLALVGEEGDIDLSNTALDFAFHNDINSLQYDTTNALYHLLESSGENTFKDGHLANNNTLFRYGDSFGVDTFMTFANRSGYTFKIINISTNSIEIKFSAK